MLSNGSPIPMTTMFVSVCESGMENIWLRISAAERLPEKCCFPVIQKAHAILHPTCVEMQIVARELSGM